METTQMKKMLIVRTDNTVELANQGGLEALNAAVGGYIEGISIHGGFMFCHDEGKLCGAPINAIATALFESRWGKTDVICGNVVITGDADSEGESMSVTYEMIEKVHLLQQGLRSESHLFHCADNQTERVSGEHRPMRTDANGGCEI